MISCVWGLSGLVKFFLSQVLLMNAARWEIMVLF